MDEKRSPNFLVGFLIGTLVVLIVWYWQKATSAEDGALDLLNRHAATEAQLREVTGQSTRPAPRPSREPYTGPSDDLEQILGIGPVYAQRLNDAGIYTYADLAGQTPDHLREITGISLKRTAEAAEWIGDARRLSAG
jgi:predicted flap endonuclease-1-like 5' DNA nuclease